MYCPEAKKEPAERGRSNIAPVPQAASILVSGIDHLRLLLAAHSLVINKYFNS